MKKSVLLLFLTYFFVEASFADDMAPANVIPDQPAATVSKPASKVAKKKSPKREIARHKKKKKKKKHHRHH